MPASQSPTTLLDINNALHYSNYGPGFQHNLMSTLPVVRSPFGDGKDCIKYTYLNGDYAYFLDNRFFADIAFDYSKSLVLNPVREFNIPANDDNFQQFAKVTADFGKVMNVYTKKPIVISQHFTPVGLYRRGEKGRDLIITLKDIPIVAGFNRASANMYQKNQVKIGLGCDLKQRTGQLIMLGEYIRSELNRQLNEEEPEEKYRVESSFMLLDKMNHSSIADEQRVLTSESLAPVMFANWSREGNVQVSIDHQEPVGMSMQNWNEAFISCKNQKLFETVAYADMTFKVGAWMRGTGEIGVYHENGPYSPSRKLETVKMGVNLELVSANVLKCRKNCPWPAEKSE